ncbi:hypothetical protein KQX54_020305 [Cotesia glomerata]|uniref:F-box domain-containing protein n=1 Tax=Cotesia glomerata TaxID=32391 RepID=A0AAV7IPM6_COTGL|nr:hypothetical protein KQX54_020305 [Cotesia glomerata]
METWLPVEIWIYIFELLDLSKLMELRLVSRFFYNLIESYLNTSPIWKDLSENMMYDYMSLTMQRAYPYVFETHDWHIDDPILWRGTYLSYKKWQFILENEHEKDFIVPMSGRVSINDRSVLKKPLWK